MLISQSKFFNDLYKEGYRAGPYFGGNRTRLIVLTQKIKKKIDEKGWPRLIDIGCGNGIFSLYFAGIGANTVGVDISRVAVDKAKKTARLLQISNVDFLVCSANYLPFRDCSFDIIFHSEVLEHLKHPEMAVSESGRVLRKGGNLIASIPCANRYSYEWFVSKLKGRLRRTHEGFFLFYWDISPKVGHPMYQRFTAEQIIRLYAKCGISIKEIEYHAHFFTPLIEYQIYRNISPYSRPNRELYKSSSKLFRFLCEILDEICRLDYVLFKKYPFGSNMFVDGLKL